MICDFFKSVRSVSLRTWAGLALVAPASLFLGGCATTGGGGNYHTTAYQATDPSAVRVKVSLATQNVYVEEGNQLLMATPTCIGRPGYETPTGDFHVMDKIQDKRSSTYGYWVNGSEAHAGTSAQDPGPGWHYVGYPMAFWVEFTPGYGFHEGPIWPYPRSHGCLHIHETASAKLFQLVHVGTPVEVARSLPEDSQYHVARPSDYADPDPPASLMTSPDFFNKPRDTQLLPAPSPSA
jgi:lipoprotein-anchoring transpeptidase ErfK/SrfK